MPSTGIPPELVTHIVDFLAGDDTSLRAVSLVSSQFRWPSQRILFSTLHLRLRGPPWREDFLKNSPGVKLLRLMEGSPWIGDSIRSIRIDNAGRNWLAIDDSFPVAMGLLNLDKIEHFEVSRLIWSSLQVQAKQVISAILGSPSLVSLSITGAPIAVINCCSHSLKHLKIHNMFVAPLDLEGLMRRSPFRLQSLHVGRQIQGHLVHIVDFLLDKTNQIDFSGVTQLSTHSEEHCLRLLWQACNPCLKMLHIGSISESENRQGRHHVSEGPLNLSGLINLRKVAISGMDSMFGTEDFHSWHLQRSSALLRTILPSNLLEHIHIHLVYGFATSKFTITYQKNWQQLDDMLTTNMGQFWKLKTVEIELEEGFDGCGKPDRLENYIATSLPNIRSNGLFKLTRTSGKFYPFEEVED
ncbi:hypothetical protein FA15DRAFT_667224 [Coprinopsis marcescibilis]|uniref:F-box domain-containing protein n=1 Tax=Coprinopsis marcescibilis TaxID=230819 RepID=A0A5C3L1W7_COPMA|nr:hypothetical protein FA15DRAFT_667224 [Coprinopsis marcescibilis]